MVEAREFIDGSGGIVESAMRLADAILPRLKEGARVSVSMAGMHGVSSSYFNVLLKRVMDECGPDAVRRRVHLRFNTKAQEGLYWRSREALLPAPEEPTQRGNPFHEVSSGGMEGPNKMEPIDEDSLFWRGATRVAEGILGQLRTAGKRGAVSDAVELLLNRMIEDINSLWVLRLHSAHEYGFSGAVILRAMYDTHLQALYILRDPRQSETRARLYLDFEWVERDNLRRMIDKNPTAVAGKLRVSPRRQLAEPHLDEQFNRIKANYVDKRGRRCRDTWYEGRLRSLAKAVRLESEYELLQRELSGVVHSSAFAMRYGPVISARHLLTMAWDLVFRVLGRVAELHEIELTDEQREVIEGSYASMV